MAKIILHQSDLNDSLEISPSSTPTVLVVEDERRFALELKGAFASQKINTLLAHDGNVGLAIAMCRKPDLMLLDTRMLRRSGYLVLEYLATQTDFSIPTVLLSENEGERHKYYGRMLGAIAILEKPLESAEVVAKVVCLLKSKSTLQ